MNREPPKTSRRRHPGWWFGSLLSVATLGVGIFEVWNPWAEAPLTELLERQLRQELRSAFVAAEGEPGRTADALRQATERFVQQSGVSRVAAGVIEEEMERRLRAAAASNQRGADLAGAGRFEAARAEFQAALDHDGENPDSWSNLAAAQASLGQYEAARVAYENALRLAPDDPVVRFNLGLLFVRTQNLEAAVAELSFALRAAEKQQAEGHAGAQETLRTLRRDLATNPLLGEVRRHPAMAGFLGGDAP